MQGIDTRALTRHLRTRGAMKACLTTEITSADEAVQRAIDGRRRHRDGLRARSNHAEYFSMGSGRSTEPEHGRCTAGGSSRRSANPASHRRFRLWNETQHSALASATRIRRHRCPGHNHSRRSSRAQPEGVFLSNGPGDPEALPYAHETVRGLMGRKPIFGICLGHQVLGFAFGGRTFKLKFGHRGGNQPVKDLRIGQSGNHIAKSWVRGRCGFIAERNRSDPCEPERRYGRRNASQRIADFSVQYHPEAAPGPHDASYFFDQFAELIEQ